MDGTMDRTEAKIRVNVPCNIEDIFVLRRDQPFVFSVCSSGPCLPHDLILGIACFSVRFYHDFVCSEWLACIPISIALCVAHAEFSYVSDVILMGSILGSCTCCYCYPFLRFSVLLYTTDTSFSG